MTRLRPKCRAGRCYELAWRYLAIDDRFPDWRLMHGAVVSPIATNLVGHAWLEHNGKIYDPVLNRECNVQAYYAKYRAKMIASYSRDEALSIGATNGHDGPWDDSFRKFNEYSPTTG
jgi:hypothetical protein